MFILKNQRFVVYVSNKNSPEWNFFVFIRVNTNFWGWNGNGAEFDQRSAT